MSSWNPDCEINISDSEDEDLNLTDKFFGRDSIIFIVDANLCRSSELLDNALVMLRSAFLSGLLVNDKDLIGLLFFNTEHTPLPFEPNCLDEIIVPNNCAVFLPPRQLNNTIVDHFLRFVETAPVQFCETYGVASSNNSCNFSQMLRLCLDLVQHCNNNVDNTSLVFITDKESPHSDKSEYYMKSLQKAVDLKENDIEFLLIPMKDDFNYDLFYKEFICLVQNIDLDSFEPCEADRLRELLANRKLKQNFMRRSLGHFKLELAPNLSLSAQYFSYYQKDKRPNKILLQRCDNALVRRSRLVQARNFVDNSSEECRNINIKHAFYEVIFSQNNIRLSYEQINRIRNMNAPNMILLGFKPCSALKFSKYTKSCNFMYPDDLQIEGSKRLFKALWNRCLIRNKVAICLFMCKRNSKPRYVALTPVSKNESSDVKMLPLSSDGFKIIYLPPVSFIRDFDVSDWHFVENQIEDNELHVCEKLIKKFRLDYKPEVLSNPDLDELQTKLLRLAFNINYESFGSQYFPNPEQQDIRMNSIIDNLKEIYGLDKELSKKRDGNQLVSETNPKKIKVLPENLDDKPLILQMISDKTLNACTKDQLCHILKVHFNKNIPTKYKKQDLLDIVYSL